MLATSFGFVVFVLTFLFVRDTPESVGMRPYGVAEGDGKSLSEPNSDVPDVNTFRALHTVSFWAIFFAYGLLAVSLQGVLSNIVNWGNSVGINLSSAGLAATASHEVGQPRG